MASFDIVTSSVKAYKSGWAARAYLMRLAIVPCVLKLFCFTLAASYAGDDNHLRFILIMLPALFAEGWMLSHWTRFLVLGQTWPFRATGDFDADMAVLAVRARGVLSGTVVFVLINMVLGLMMAFTTIFIMPYMPEDPTAGMANVPPQIVFAAFSMLVFMLWGFRLFWLYIPYALNIDIKTYLTSVRGWGTSFYMLGAWILCLAPFLFLLRILSGLIAAPVSAVAGDSAGSFVMILLLVIIDTAKGLITTAGIVYGLQEIFDKRVRT